ncbi:hypothetical protein [Ensifer sp.]|nr:hypothetical protein [Ensifer sp.]
MRIVAVLLVLSSLAGCSQTAGGSSVREDYYGGDGGFYAGAVAPR